MDPRIEALRQQQIIRQRQQEDRVLLAAEQLDPADTSLEAEQIREAAGSIRDHRAADEMEM